MRIIDFLPDASLAFIVWTISSLIFGIIFWLIAYWIPKKTWLSGIYRFEYAFIFTLLYVVLIFILGTLSSRFSFIKNATLNQAFMFFIAFIVSLVTVLFSRKRWDVINILLDADERITPVVWFFLLMLLIAFSVSILRIDSSTNQNNKLVNSIQTGFQNEKRPNIILVTMDALTANDMQLYGYERITTPFISEWAKGAFIFKSTYAESNWTTPTSMSLMTGQRPWTHKLWYEPQYQTVDNYVNNLPRVMGDNGYRVYGFVQNNLAHPKTLGINDAFLKDDDAYTFLTAGKWWITMLTNFFVKRRIAAELIIENNPLLKPINLKHSRHPAYMRFVIYSSPIKSETVYNRYLDFIHDNPKEPFFTWIHLFPPHDLYLPPSPFMGVFGESEKFSTGDKQLDSNLLYAEYSQQRQDEVNALRQRYDEYVLYSDQQFKSFVSRLAKTIDMSNTIIIVSADHGESFSHGYVGHNGSLLYESLIHIPLIIKLPGHEESRMVDMPVEQIDIAPTILDLAKIPLPDWMEGRSLLPLIQGKSVEPRPVFSMQLIRNRAIGNFPITRGTISVRDGDYKLIYNLDDKKSLLFNISADPEEKHDSSDVTPEIAKRLKGLIDENLYIANRKIMQYKKN